MRFGVSLLYCIFSELHCIIFIIEAAMNVIQDTLCHCDACAFPYSEHICLKLDGSPEKAKQPARRHICSYQKCTQSLAADFNCGTFSIYLSELTPVLEFAKSENRKKQLPKVLP